jgi:phthalate 4,5-cis-dihydrodiol dehydrogenase
MSSQILRAAVIGCGEHSRENLIPSLALQEGVNITATCDIDIGAAASAARHFPACKVETSFHRIFETDGLDAIIVAATPSVHYTAARIALENNVHVFVEKPPTATRDELVELAELADARNLVTCVGHNLRHATAAIELQSLLNAESTSAEQYSEVFGNPVAMEMRYYASKPKGDRWNLNSPIRSFLLSHANHAIDFMIYQMGPIAKVNAVIASENVNGIALSVQFCFQRGGAIGNLLATSYAPFFAISGTIISNLNRIAQLNSLHEVVAYGIGDDKKRWGRCWTSKTLLNGHEAAGYSNELGQFIRAALAKQPDQCHPSFRDEIAVYDAIDEIERILKDQ